MTTKKTTEVLQSENEVAQLENNTDSGLVSATGEGIASVLDLNDLIGLGLSEKEANAVLKLRNTRSEHISMRLSVAEVKELDRVKAQLSKMGSIKDTYADTIAWMTQHCVITYIKQVTLDEAIEEMKSSESNTVFVP